MTKCCYAECSRDNYSTALLTVDVYGIQWFCDEHWKVMCLLFNGVVYKCLKNNKCTRNYHAEFDPEASYLTTVKHDNKFFDLCDKHYNIYEELLGINSLFEYD